MAIGFAECGFNIRQFAARHGRCFASVFLGMTATVILSLTSAHAGVPASCDPDYWNAMKGKAWMEAQREIEQNQNLIYKADSVLEYTCFDKFLNVLAKAAPDMFSMTNDWGSVTPMPDMTNSLQILVGSAAATWVNSNFNHSFLGARSTSPTYTLGGVSAGDYDCDVMAQVWERARCMNFVDKNHDDFYDLTVYDGNDARRLPSFCTADTRWAANKDAAANTGSTPYKTETYNMYNAFFNTTACSAAPIPTGVTVKRPPLADYDEKICVNPGCAYNGSSTCTTTP